VIKPSSIKGQWCLLSLFLEQNTQQNMYIIVIDICSLQLMVDWSEKLLLPHHTYGKGLPSDIVSSSRGRCERLAKRSMQGDAVMIGILVTRFKMGLVDVEGLELIAANATSETRCLAARKVLKALRGAA